MQELRNPIIPAKPGFWATGEYLRDVRCVVRLALALRRHRARRAHRRKSDMHPLGESHLRLPQL